MKPSFATSILGVILCSALLGVAQSAHANKCTMSNVAGRYGYTTTGTVVSPPVGPFVGVGEIRLTESGTLSGTQTTSIGGNVASGEIVQGTFTVNPDCTGTMTVSIFRGSTLVRTAQLNLVWDDNRKEARAIFLNPGTSITIQAKRMFQDDDD